MIKFFGGKKDATDQTHATEPVSGAEEAPKSGFFSRMKQAVSRTRESLSSKIESIVALTRTVDENALESLEAVLLTSDLGVETTNAILTALRERAKLQAIEGGDELRAAESSDSGDSRSANCEAAEPSAPADGRRR
jgi:signal recognition particle GTPase